MQRAAGMLMPVSSLPSRGGIGTFGKKAFDFLDDAEKAPESVNPALWENAKNKAIF